MVNSAGSILSDLLNKRGMTVTPPVTIGSRETLAPSQYANYDHMGNMQNERELAFQQRDAIAQQFEPVTLNVDYNSETNKLLQQAMAANNQAGIIRAGTSYVQPQFQGQGGGNVNVAMPGGRFGTFLQAISGQESGGNYGAVNNSSGAMGKYQVMPSNIAGPGGWDKEALGYNISPSQFLHNPKLQEAIVRYKLRQYFNQYGAAGAASAWYSGNPNAWKTSHSAQGNYPSIYNYVMSILNRMKG